MKLHQVLITAGLTWVGGFLIGLSVGLSIPTAHADPPVPAICDKHAEHYDSPFGLLPGHMYITACGVGNGGGWDYGQGPAEEEPAPAPAPAP